MPLISLSIYNLIRIIKQIIFGLDYCLSYKNSLLLLPSPTNHWRELLFEVIKEEKYVSSKNRTKIEENVLFLEIREKGKECWCAIVLLKSNILHNFEIIEDNYTSFIALCIKYNTFTKKHDFQLSLIIFLLTSICVFPLLFNIKNRLNISTSVQI